MPHYDDYPLVKITERACWYQCNQTVPRYKTFGHKPAKVQFSISARLLTHAGLELEGKSTKLCYTQQCNLPPACSLRVRPMLLKLYECSLPRARSSSVSSQDNYATGRVRLWEGLFRMPGIQTRFKLCASSRV